MSEVIYAFGQGLFIFFVAPYIEDSSMIVGAYLIITLPLILSISFPQVCSNLYFSNSERIVAYLQSIIFSVL